MATRDEIVDKVIHLSAGESWPVSPAELEAAFPPEVRHGLSALEYTRTFFADRTGSHVEIEGGMVIFTRPATKPTP